MLANTQGVDVWYLFPRKAVVQQLARDLRGVDEGKRQKLGQIFGTDEWEAELYESRPAQGGLFDGPTLTKDRIATPQQISAFARTRLKTLFCYMSEPLPLIVNGHEFFELYCLSNNRNAISLIQRGVDHVMQKYSGASRRRFAL